MKCLLCSSTFENQEDLLRHYTDYHNVDEKIGFFRNHFKLRIRLFYAVLDVRSF